MNYNEAKILYSDFNIELTEDCYNKYLKYKDELIDWNNNINLTAITDDRDVWIKHFIDSSIVNKYVNNNSKLIDVGTGAGFPGIPVKINNNSINVLLLDSLNKRINFLNNIISSLELKNINCMHGRAEDIANDINYRESFDYATARAVANLSTLSELCLPFVKVGGYFICMKADNSDEEIENAKNAIKELGGNIEKIDKYNLPGTDINRVIVLIKKIKSTPKKYPRKAGTPSKQPL